MSISPASYASKHRMDILVDNGTAAESLLIASSSKLARRSTRRLPLIRPNSDVRACRSGHCEPRVLLIAITLKTKAKTANPREQFGHSNCFSRHSVVF